MEARPTEWRGVVYKSKSEACMAKFLSNFGRTTANGSFIPSLLIYEPYWLTASDGWVPDFLAINTERRGLGATFYIVEYKPSKPTETYFAELGKRFNSVRKSSGSFGDRMACSLWCGLGLIWRRAKWRAIGSK